MSEPCDPTLAPLSRRSVMLGGGAMLAATGLRWSPASAEQSALRDPPSDDVKSVFFGISASPYDHERVLPVR